jgi:hypothetical protein
MHDDRATEIRSRYERIRDVGEDSLQEALFLLVKSSMQSEAKPKYQIDLWALAIYLVIMLGTIDNRDITIILILLGLLFLVFWAYKSYFESERRREAERDLEKKLDALFRRDRLERIKAGPSRPTRPARRRPSKASTDLGA